MNMAGSVNLITSLDLSLTHLVQNQLHNDNTKIAETSLVALYKGVDMAASFAFKDEG